MNIKKKKDEHQNLKVFLAVVLYAFIGAILGVVFALLSLKYVG